MPKPAWRSSRSSGISAIRPLVCSSLPLVVVRRTSSFTANTWKMISTPSSEMHRRHQQLDQAHASLRAVEIVPSHLRRS